MHFGYARVSAKDQNLDTQLKELTAAGADRIFQEKITGASTSRPELDKMLAMLRPGDTVLVNRLSRLGRNTAHLLQLIADFTANDVRFVALDLGIDTSTPAGRMVVTVFAALAEFERESNGERRQAGIELAKAQGKHLGRPAGVDEEKLKKVKTSLAAGLSIHQIVDVTGISESTVKRYRRLLTTVTPS
ncbi:recombinase family protein [Hymenobacter sp. HSC-4F20]|uniref:recombinase family protein n=1 Tax=Hymenobacter sp. HSC-4F20 TaxID=2864135 RepID=UPI001C732A43|nr:recombinase family protein [Hymenobacter sp. HSC-4F20]MBX0289447.1 recombinase family protein [Hymenobacter sp. HSC-4F20]